MMPGELFNRNGEAFYGAASDVFSVCARNLLSNWCVTQAPLANCAQTKPPYAYGESPYAYGE